MSKAPGLQARIFSIPRYVAAALLITFFLFSCGGDETPKDQVKQFVAAGEKAAEERNIGDIKALISEGYNDRQGRTRKDLVAICLRYILANKNIHILSRIGKLQFPTEEKARLELYVAMTGQNVSDLDALLNMQADLYLFDMELRREGGKWRLFKAEWRPAGPEDFF